MSRKPATRSTKRTAASVKSPGGGRQAVIWSPKLYDKAVEEDNFIQVYLDDEELKRRPNNLRLTGAKNMWKQDDKADYIYEPVSRLAGPQDAVEAALNEFEKQIKKATKDNSSIATLLKGAYAKGTKSKKYQSAIASAAKKKKAHLKATREAQQEGAFAPSEMKYVYNAFTEGKKGKRGSKAEKAEKKTKPRKTGLYYMLGKAREMNKKDEKGEGPYVVDVSKIGVNGTGSHIIPASKAAADENLQTLQNVDDWIIYSSNAKSFNDAMRVLSDKSKSYLKFQGKLGKSVSGDLASGYAARVKDEIKSYKKANETEEEEKTDSEDTDEEEEEKPKKKTAKKTTKKPAKEDTDEEEEEEKPKKTTKKAAAKPKPSASRSASRSTSPTRTTKPAAKASAKPAAKSASRSASRSGSPTRATKPAAKTGSRSGSPTRKNGNNGTAAAEQVPEPATEETSAAAAASTLRSKASAKPGARRLPPKRAPAAAGSPGGDESD